MSPQRHKHTGLAAALGIAAALAATSPAQSTPIDAATRMDHRATEAALAQEQYYMSHKPADAGSGPVVETRYEGRDLRTIDARDAADAPGGAVTHVAAPAEPAGSDGIELGDAAIGSGATLGLVLLLAGGAAVISRRQRPATP